MGQFKHQVIAQQEVKRIVASVGLDGMILELEGLITAGMIATKDLGFAGSLVSKHTNYKQLSEKQIYWVGRMIERALSGDEPNPVVEEGLTGMFKLFEATNDKLQWPKIRLQTDSGLPIVLSIAGSRAKAPGTINITDGGKYGENIWYGRISKEGVWESPAIQAKGFEAIRALIHAFNEDPEVIAATQGKVTGHCCFCSKELTSEESLGVGYGKTCAHNFGVPWGKTNTS